jgi:hypothetical protein
MISLAAEIARAAGERTPRALLTTTRQWAERAVLSPQRDIGLGGIHLPEPHIVGADSAAGMRTLLRTRSEAGINWRYNDSATIANLDRYKADIAALTDPRKTSEAEAKRLIGTTKPMYWLTSGIHSPETGGPEMLQELAYRLIVQESSYIQTIRNNIITFITQCK